MKITKIRASKFFITVLFLFLPLLANAVDYTLQDYYDGIHDLNTQSIVSPAERAECFTASSSYSITKVSIYGSKNNSPDGYVQLDIFASTAEYLPTGNSLNSKSLPASGMSATNAWFEFVLDSSFSVTANNKYCLVLSYSGSESVNWPKDYTSDYYANGAFSLSSNSGSTWSFDGAGQDANFKLYSSTGGEQPPESGGIGTSTPVFIDNPSDYTSIWFYSIILFTLGFYLGLKT